MFYTYWITDMNMEMQTKPQNYKKKTCNKGIKMNCWESLFIHIFQQQDTLIDEQRVNDLNPLYTLANVTRLYTM